MFLVHYMPLSTQPSLNSLLWFTKIYIHDSGIGTRDLLYVLIVRDSTGGWTRSEGGSQISQNSTPSLPLPIFGCLVIDNAVTDTPPSPHSHHCFPWPLYMVISVTFLGVVLDNPATLSSITGEIAASATFKQDKSSNMMISPASTCMGTISKYYEKLKDATGDRKP